MSAQIIAPTNGFTDSFIKNLKSKEKDYELSDKGCKGLRIKVTKE
ncbi:MAG: DUF4102 domain-containing protein [Gammaproteobacteria bacterium]|nr:DUF4102 domain-containing protein [Gammaproteobacteria bacterium]